MDYASLKEQYDQNMPTYKEFCDYFKKVCSCLLSEADIPYFELSFRIKTWDSILEKIERHQLRPQQIDEIHDIIGFRIITLFKRDVNIVCDIITQKLKILYYDDKSKTKSDDVFGYLSVHYEISLPDEWLNSPLFAKYKNIQTELQIRTFSQHVWAASSHLLQYKIESSVPAAMRRDIYRLAAVLEIVDNELENIRNFRDNYQLEVKKLSQNENPMLPADTPLDSILLETILDRFFPHENKKNHEPFDNMLSELLAASIKTTGELEQLLSSQISYIISKENNRKKEVQHPFYSYIGLLRMALSRKKHNI
ncbi:MAG: GTP pyrophosphokinase family protein [Anaerotignum lactatifermentans]|uniref:GTP pyrophosphokinase n=1 Tax=Anaerotignum lactatifermentans TaxID=160404 RepID=UPI0013A67132|nr:hypothetical protein [Anaerotignum lactatifermentans]